jgi:hypothetical protein
MPVASSFSSQITIVWSTAAEAGPGVGVGTVPCAVGLAAEALVAGPDPVTAGAGVVGGPIDVLGGRVGRVAGSNLAFPDEVHDARARTVRMKIPAATRR